MSLATRCIHCHTTFKVVQDQLKVSQGWVKCGQCHQAFNALEAMFDTDQLSVWSESMLSSDVTTTPEPAPAATTTADDEDAFDLSFPPIPDIAEEKPNEPVTPEAPPETAKPDTHITPPVDEAPIVVAPAPTTTVEPPPPVDIKAPEPTWAHLLAIPQPDVIEKSLPPPSQRRGKPGTRGRAPAPRPTGFIQQAEKQAIWRHPAIRATLALMALLLIAALGMQMAHHWRNQLAATYPTTKPWLQAWCDIARCQLVAPMDINALSVDSITVVKAESQGTDAYQLTVIVQNNSRIPLQWPLLDLTLTNSNGEVLTRRSLRVDSAQQVPVTDDHNKAPTQHSPVAPTAQPGLTALQWQMRAPDLQLASYTAELFYP